MTSMPASRSARATTLTPRSWPSSPTLARSTRIGTFTGFLPPPLYLVYLASASPRRPTYRTGQSRKRQRRIFRCGIGLVSPPYGSSGSIRPLEPRLVLLPWLTDLLHALCDISSSSYISTFNCNEEDSGFVIAKAPDQKTECTTR